MVAPLYIFLDEGGNFDFSLKGTKYFTLTALTTRRPFLWESDLINTKYDLLEQGLNIEYFHATEDKQPTRQQVFASIMPHLTQLRLDALIIEKRKARPQLQVEEVFYPRMLAYLLRFILKQVVVADNQSVVIMTDVIPINKKREAVEKATKETFHAMFPTRVAYQIVHHASKSSATLQVVDYCNWAIYRKWANEDKRSYALIANAIKSEYDIFQAGTTYYY
jgi:hypothetical protein